MLAKRLIAKLQIVKDVLVTTRQFDDIIEIGDPASQAKIYESQGIDELVLLRIRKTGDTKQLIEMTKSINESIFMPLTVGGGIETIEDIRELLRNGADKVSINSEAVRNPAFLHEVAVMFGCSTIVLSIDYKNNHVFINTNIQTDLNPIEWAMMGEKLGAGEILLTCIDRDGTQQGLDLFVGEEVIKSVGIPVVLSGGCGLASHFNEGFKIGASGIAAGTFFCFQDQNICQTKAHINNAGIHMRV